MSDSYDLGRQGEDDAVNFLIQKGYRIKARNWHFGKGEIDIVAENDEYLVFVEVKTRQADTFGNPEDFVSRRQQKQLLRVADRYVEEFPNPREVRMDVIAITLHPHYRLDHIEEAFYP